MATASESEPKAVVQLHGRHCTRTRKTTEEPQRPRAALCSLITQQTKHIVKCTILDGALVQPPMQAAILDAELSACFYGKPRRLRRTLTFDCLMRYTCSSTSSGASRMAPPTKSMWSSGCISITPHHRRHGYCHCHHPLYGSLPSRTRKSVKKTIG